MYIICHRSLFSRQYSFHIPTRVHTFLYINIFFVSNIIMALIFFKSRTQNFRGIKFSHVLLAR